MMNKTESHEAGDHAMSVAVTIFTVIVSVIILYTLAASPSVIAQGLALVMAVAAFTAFALIGLRCLRR